VPLLLAVRGRSAGQAFLFGLAYGFVCSATVAGWLATTMVSFFGLPPVAGRLVAGAYGVAFWGTAFGLFAAGAARLARTRRPGWAIGTAALWVATELLRGRVFGQPWCLLGYSQHANLPLIQLAALTAVYGPSFLVALGNVAVAEAIARLRAGRPRDAWRPLALPAALTGAVWIAGARVLPTAPLTGTLPIAIVQTNVPPARRWTRAYTDRQIMTHAGMTDRLGPEMRGGIIVWPENAVPRHLEAEPGLAGLLAARARSHGSDLLFGAPRFADGHTYNSVRLITATGHYGGHYDKQRLVLLAEADPFGTPPQSGPEENPTRFTPGQGPGVLRGVVPMGVSVCHEVLFPDLAARAVAAGAELLVNVSNDGWLDPATGVASRQHAAMAVFRAVETRRWLARAATTGISAVVDPYGRVVAALPPDTAGVLQARVAPRTDVAPYVRFGDAFAIACVLIAAGALLRSRV
jgi:apolipoprotein N-acyltransferase